MDKLNTISDLKLYHYESCPYSAITRQVIEEIGISIEKRDILLNPRYRIELIKGGGKPQVPALRIERMQGETQWLYESEEIIRFLHEYVSRLALAS